MTWEFFKWTGSYFFRYVQSSQLGAPSAILIYQWLPDVDKVSRANCGEHDLDKDHHLASYSEKFTKVTTQRDTMKDALM